MAVSFTDRGRSRMRCDNLYLCHPHPSEDPEVCTSDKVELNSLVPQTNSLSFFKLSIISFDDWKCSSFIQKHPFEAMREGLHLHQSVLEKLITAECYFSGHRSCGREIRDFSRYSVSPWMQPT